MQSGDLVKVAAAIKDADSLPREALLAVTKNSKSKFAAEVRRVGIQGEHGAA